MEWLSSIIGGLIGAIIASLFIILIEHLRRPEITLSIEEPVDAAYENRPANSARFLRLNVMNKNLPHKFSWMSRNTAIRCSGLITFYHLNDGQDIFGRSMQTKWGRIQDPLPLFATINGQEMKIYDPQRLAPQNYIDIYVGEKEPLDVVARFNNEDDCYGWSYDSYFSKPPWRNPDWKMGKGRYLVKVELIYSGGRHFDVFRVINDAPMNAFRLEMAQREDYQKLGLKK